MVNIHRNGMHAYCNSAVIFDHYYLITSGNLRLPEILYWVWNASFVFFTTFVHNTLRSDALRNAWSSHEVFVSVNRNWYISANTSIIKTLKYETFTENAFSGFLVATCWQTDGEKYKEWRKDNRKLAWDFLFPCEQCIFTMDRILNCLFSKELFIT
jgi:hypothetical protein